MRVTIVDIRPAEGVGVPGTMQIGYPAEFKTPFVEGYATIVPCAGASSNLARGRSIEVEARHAYISRFQELPGEGTEKMEPLPQKGDYAVEAPVVFSYDSGNFGVESGGFIFTLDRDDARGSLPAPGRWVSFHLHGLSLWDRNL